jgi:hypothetical protein
LRVTRIGVGGKRSFDSLGKRLLVEAASSRVRHCLLWR